MHVVTYLLLQIDLGAITSPTNSSTSWRSSAVTSPPSGPVRAQLCSRGHQLRTSPSLKLETWRQWETHAGSIPPMWIPPQPHRLYLFLASPTLYPFYLSFSPPVDVNLEHHSEIGCYRLLKQLLQLHKLQSLKIQWFCFSDLIYSYLDEI